MIDKVPNTYLSDLGRVDLARLQTPASIFFEDTATSHFRNASRMAEEISSAKLKVANAYSIKTNPDERLIRLPLEHGFFAEAISLLEVKKALQSGFRPDQVILNGPAKWWRRETLPDAEFYSIFCDSVEELERVVGEIEKGTLRTRVLGTRLRTPGVFSRFGIPIATPESFGRLVEAVGKMPDGLAVRRPFSYGQQQRRRKALVASVRVDAALVRLDRGVDGPACRSSRHRRRLVSRRFR